MKLKLLNTSSLDQIQSAYQRIQSNCTYHDATISNLLQNKNTLAGIKGKVFFIRFLFYIPCRTIYLLSMFLYYQIREVVQILIYYYQTL